MPATLSSALLPEFDHETANTRRVLERVPLDRSTWTPHTKSMTMGRLATHLAQIPVWATLGLTRDEFDLTPSFEPAEATTTDGLLEVFDREVTRARGLLAGADDAQLMQTWTFKKDGHVVFAMPKIVVVRTFVMNHMIHHRGQLSVYLRMNDVPVPSLYGPSADEG